MKKPTRSALSSAGAALAAARNAKLSPAERSEIASRGGRALAKLMTKAERSAACRRAGLGYAAKLAAMPAAERLAKMEKVRAGRKAGRARKAASKHKASE